MKTPPDLARGMGEVQQVALGNTGRTKKAATEGNDAVLSVHLKGGESGTVLYRGGPCIDVVRTEQLRMEEPGGLNQEPSPSRAFKNPTLVSSGLSTAWEPLGVCIQAKWCDNCANQFVIPQTFL